jgi:ferritin-like metal-binding protein YciE
MGLREVMLEELRDLYSAENQLVKALQRSMKRKRARFTISG